MQQLHRLAPVEKAHIEYIVLHCNTKQPKFRPCPKGWERIC